MIELKPCPFCGGKAEFSQVRISQSRKNSAVRCTKCFISSPYYHSEDAAAEAWNRRTPEPERRIP